MNGVVVVLNSRHVTSLRRVPAVWSVVRRRQAGCNAFTGGDRRHNDDDRTEFLRELSAARRHKTKLYTAVAAARDN